MSRLLDQLPTLIGVLVGAVASYFATAASERARWRRTQSARWDEVRMRAYVDYANAVKRVIHLASRIAVARGLDHAADAIPIDKGLFELNAAMADRTAKWESVLLLGNVETVAAARAWHTAVWRLEYFARGKLSGQLEWDSSLRDVEQARTRFYDAARNDLGVGGQVPAAQWPPTWLPQVRTDGSQQAAGGTPSGNAVGNNTGSQG